jgi:predicted RNA-binding protein
LGDLKSGGNMCEANAYLVKDGKEELVLEDISILRPERDELYLQNLFGEQKKIKARIKEINLIDHRIILEEI